MKHFHHFLAKVFVYDNGIFEKMITYHKIDHRRQSTVDRFEEFIKREFPGVHHINYYDGQDGTYQYQKRF